MEGMFGIRALWLTSFAATLCACGPITFSTTISGEGVVEGSALGSLLSAFPMLNGLASINFDQNQDFKNNKTTRDMVRSVKVTSLVVSVKSPTNGRLDFIDSLELTAKADGLPDAMFARKENIPQGASGPPNASVAFELLGVELAPYIRAPTTSLTLSGRGRQPAQDTTLRVDVVLSVGASPF